MATLSLNQDERRAFLELYSYREQMKPVPKPLVDALIRYGLLARKPDNSLCCTELGDELYEQLRPDEPYEGV